MSSVGTFVGEQNFLIAYGNSRTGGSGASSDSATWVAQFFTKANALLGARTWSGLNRGIGGAAMDELLTTYADDVGSVKNINPGWYNRRVFAVFEAINMLSDGHTASEVIAANETMVGLGVADGFEVWIGTPLQGNGTSPGAGDLGTVAQAIRDNYVSWGATGIIDYEVIPALDPSGSAANPTYWSDGIHPNDAGYGEMADAAVAAILA